MSNVVSLFADQAQLNSNREAIAYHFRKWSAEKSVTFGELNHLACRMQQGIQGRVQSGDLVLLMVPFSIDLFALIIAILAQGATVVFIEPWMPKSEIVNLLKKIKPKVVIYEGFLAKMWASRYKKFFVNFFSLSSCKGSFASKVLKIETGLEDKIAILTFTTGSTGTPKGVVRRHSYLLKQREVIEKYLFPNEENTEKADVVIFASFVLLNLSSGRTSYLVSPKWKKHELRWLESKNVNSLTSGPKFLEEVMQYNWFKKLKHIHVGGATAAISLFEKARSLNSTALFFHLYGGTEAEPVAIALIDDVIKISKERKLYQALFLGKPVDEISFELKSNGLWISGSHVCPEYYESPVENETNKFKDLNGIVWHKMGDQILLDQEGWFYSGRVQWDSALFWLEQSIYSTIQLDRGFLYPIGSSRYVLVGEELFLKKYHDNVIEKDPRIVEIRRVRKLKYDVRHRARINRELNYNESTLLKRKG